MTQKISNNYLGLNSIHKAYIFNSRRGICSYARLKVLSTGECQVSPASKTMPYPVGQSKDISVLTFAGAVMHALAKQKDDNVMLVLPESSAIRALQAQALFNKAVEKGNVSKETIAEICAEVYQDSFMTQEWGKAIASFVQGYAELRATGATIGIMKKYQLHRWQVVPKNRSAVVATDILKAGAQITVADGVIDGEPNWVVENNKVSSLDPVTGENKPFVVSVEPGRVFNGHKAMDKFFVERRGNSVMLNNLRMTESVLEDSLPSLQEATLVACGDEI